MSTLISEVTTINSIRSHPNADRLEIATVKGWDCIVPKNKYETGDKIIYIPIDAVLTQEFAELIGVDNYLSKGRVRTIKLRGEYSQGLIIDVVHYCNKFMEKNPNATPVFPDQIALGTNVTEMLDITKYEPPLPPVEFRGKMRNRNPFFSKYISIENIKNFPDIFKEGEEVLISEKLHGTNSRFGIVRNENDPEVLEFRVGSHNIDLCETESNIYWKIARKFDIKKRLISWVDSYNKRLDIFPLPGVEKIKQFIFYGEIYGPGIQKGMHYGLSEPGIRFFDIEFNGKYLETDQTRLILDSLNLDYVPVLYEGPWKKELMDLANGLSTICKDHIREGIVIRPKIQNKSWEHIKLKKKILKHISEKYLLKDYGDNH